jgi:WD40 repeat protein
VTHLDYSPTSDKLLSISYDCTVRLMDAETGVHTQLLATYGTNEPADKFKGEPGYGVDEGEGYFTQYGCWDKENGIANGKGIWLTSSLGNLVFYDVRSGKVEINGRASVKKVRIGRGGRGEEVGVTNAALFTPSPMPSYPSPNED